MNISSTLEALKKRGLSEALLTELEQAASKLPEVYELQLLILSFPRKPQKPQLAGGDDSDQSDWQENFWKDKDWRK